MNVQNPSVNTQSDRLEHVYDVVFAFFSHQPLGPYVWKACFHGVS